MPIRFLDEQPAAPKSRIRFLDEEPQAPQIGGGEALARGAYSGVWQQPRDVIAAGVAKLGGVPFKEGLAAAREMSLEGRQGMAQQQRPGMFGVGEVGGNIALTAVPGMAATRAIGATAPVVANVPTIGGALSKTAQGIGAAKGLVGVPLSGAIQGGISTLASEGDLSGAIPGAIGAGVVGSVAKVAKPISTAGLSATRQGYNKLLEQAGINLTPAQKTANKTLELVDSVLASMPFTAGKSRDMTEAQLRKFTQQAMAKAGLTGDELTPAVRELAENQFNQKYTQLIGGQIINIDQPVLQSVSDIYTKQVEKLPTTVKPVVQSYLRDIVQSGGKMTGEAYQAARSQLTQQSRSLALSDPFTANVLRQIRNTLDDAAERSLPDAQKGAWRELNRQYANYKTIQKAVSNTSENSLEGIISPKRLLSTIETANKTKGQKGYGDLYGLALAGSSALSDSIPNSGTAQRQLTQQMLTGQILGQFGAGAGVGGLTYGVTQDPYKAALAAALPIAGPKAAQMFINSPAGQRYLTQGIPGAAAIGSNQAKTLAAILAAQSGGQ